MIYGLNDHRSGLIPVIAFILMIITPLTGYSQVDKNYHKRMKRYFDVKEPVSGGRWFRLKKKKYKRPKKSKKKKRIEKKKKIIEKPITKKPKTSVPPKKAEVEKSPEKKKTVQKAQRIGNYRIGLRTGYPVILGFIGENTSFSLPYFGVFFRPDLLKSPTLFLEAELGYIGYKSKDSFLFENKVTAIPISVSLGLKVTLSKDFYFYPKMGLGYMYLTTNSAGRGSGSSSVILLKPAWN